MQQRNEVTQTSIVETNYETENKGKEKVVLQL